MRSPVAAIMDSPRAVQIAERLERCLEEEARRRDRFLDELRADEKVEFVNGEVVVHSPARHAHNAAVANLVALLRTHALMARGGLVVCEKALVSLTRNDYEPDVVFFGREKAARLTPDLMRYPAPDFVAEVLSESTEARDRGVKAEDYAAHGVADYWIVDPDGRTVEAFALPAGADEYPAPRLARGDDELAIAAAPGFRIPVAAIFDEERCRAELIVIVSGAAG